MRISLVTVAFVPALSMLIESGYHSARQESKKSNETRPTCSQDGGASPDAIFRGPRAESPGPCHEKKKKAYASDGCVRSVARSLPLPVGLSPD